MKDKDMGSRPFATLTIAAAVLFLVLLFLLHFLKPENDPSWRLVSEYQIGRHGWLMSVAFFSLAAANASAFFALRPHVRGIAGRIGLGLFAVAAIGLVIGGLYPPDPITTPRESYSFSMLMHSWGGGFAILGMPFIALLVTLGLRREDGGVSRALVVLTAVIWAALIVWNTGSSLQYRAAEGPPEAYEWIGYPNRIFIAGYCAWLIAAVWQVRRD